MAEQQLSPEERALLQVTIENCFESAARIVERVSQSQVDAARAGALARGVSMLQAAQIDRATVASVLLRMAAKGKVQP